jgi:L-2-hydroxyglutarate oxidase LhgO
MSVTQRVDTLVVGAGVVGLAIARKLAQSGHEVLILESTSSIGSVTSSRNSGVIHAGIYYAPGSLKARMCVAGRDLLYAYVAEKGIAHKKCGKLIISTSPDECNILKRWQANAARNGVTDLHLLTAGEAQAMEPNLRCAAALHVPVTGLIDVHDYLLALQGDAEAAGAFVVFKSVVTKGAITKDGFLIEVGGAESEGADFTRIGCRHLINAAGLGAQAFARTIKGLRPDTIPDQVLAKGNYFTLSGKAPFTMLIYPLPVLGSSGLHASCDLSGRMRFGPDVEWVDHIDYRVDPGRLPLFENSIRRYWPDLPSGALHPDFAGIRPKLARGSPHDTDFLIHGPLDHGVPGLINLYGIESPGLTSSLALADEVARLMP